MCENLNTSALIRLNRLKVLGKQKKFNEIVLKSQKQLIIGREMSCDLQIDSIDISRKHAVIANEDNNWFITDLESTNGLYINGKQLLAFTPYCLKNGDKVSFGPTLHSTLIYKFVENYCSNAPVVKPLKRKVCESIDNQLAPKRVCNEWEELLDSELTCAICHELLISALTLNCSHTFCQSCIEQWKHSNEDQHRLSGEIHADTHCCPVCRQPILSSNRVLALDNVIDYMVTKWTPTLAAHRRALIEERERQRQRTTNA